MIEIGIIVATEANGGIGKDGKLPWRNKEDMKFFASTTKGDGKNAVVMGRNTWESLRYPPLKDRTNIVLSTTMQEEEGLGCLVVRSAEEAVQLAAQLGVVELWVIGGSKTYHAFEELGIVTRITVTRLNEEHECDVHYAPDTSGYAVESWWPIAGGMVTEWTRV
jgi:dihydrofolate reductase